MHTIHFYFDFSLSAARHIFEELPARLLGASYAVHYVPLGDHAAARAAWEKAGALGTPSRYVCERLFAGETPTAPPGADASHAEQRQQRAEAAARAAGVQRLPALIVGGQVFAAPLDWGVLRVVLETAENPDTHAK